MFVCNVFVISILNRSSQFNKECDNYVYQNYLFATKVTNDLQRDEERTR